MVWQHISQDVITHAAVAIAVVLLWFAGASAGSENHFAADSLSGTLARDHQSRAMYFAGQYRRTYVAYLDHHYNARVTHYDHDTRRWAFPTRVDTCIRGERPDGHNAPNLFITPDGTVHLFYGSHGHSFKYARSKRPERIDRWDIGMRVGSKGTYPYLCNTDSGRLLLFYRHGPTGGYNNPFLGVQQTDDGGRTWSQIEKPLTFRKGCKIYGNNALYDPLRKRVHLVLSVPGAPKPRWRKDRWKRYYCQYDPATRRVHAANGRAIGPTAKEADFTANNGRLVEGGIIDMCLHESVLCFLFRAGTDGIGFGRWDGRKLTRHLIPAEKLRDVRVASTQLLTPDGETFHIYALRRVPDSTIRRHLDLWVWTSRDQGKTWTNGRCLVDCRRRKLGHGLNGLNMTMDYSGSGPLFIVQQMPDFEVPWLQNLTPSEKEIWGRRLSGDLKLYALDANGHFVANGR